MDNSAKANIKLLYENALTEQKNKNFTAANKIYLNLINLIGPKAEIYFQLGKINLEIGDLFHSVNFFRLAAELRPSEAIIWENYVDACIYYSDDNSLKNLIRNLKIYKVEGTLLSRAIEALNPSKKASSLNLAGLQKKDFLRINRLLQESRWDDVVSEGRKLFLKFPGCAFMGNAIGLALLNSKEKAQSKSFFDAAVTIDPNYAEAYNNIGKYFLINGDLKNALRYLRKSIKLLPGLVICNYNLAIVHRDLKQVDSAVIRIKKLLSIDPLFLSAQMVLCELLIDKKEFDEAERVLLELKKGTKNNERINFLLSQSQEGRGQDELAIQTLNSIGGLGAHSSALFKRKAMLYQKIGQFAEAEKFFKLAIEMEPTDVQTFRLLTASCKISINDSIFHNFEKLFVSDTLSVESRTELAFSLAKIYEDNHFGKEFFEKLTIANNLMRTQFPFDMEKVAIESVELIKYFKGFDFENTLVSPTSALDPIFITGLPRSGTTLVEQIISNHSNVIGLGEIGAFSEEARLIINKTEAITNLLTSEISEKFASIGEKYSSKILKLMSENKRITDKSISNYMFLGLIKLALPNSTIIVVEREPLDNILSIYKNIFPKGTHLYSYALEDIAVQYKIFKSFIQFWQKVIPNKFHTIKYENLITNTEYESKNLIKACGLEWDEKCSTFYNNKRKVETLSLFQVRQPIYNSSVGISAAYGGEMQIVNQILNKNSF